VSARPGRVLGIVVGGLVAIAVAAAIFAALRPATTWDATTPQGTVQAYLSAVVDGDTAKAATYLDPNGPCDVQDLDQAYVVDPRRIDLVSARVDGDAARVEVAVGSSTGGGPLDGLATENHTFRLTRPGQAWFIVGSPWPLQDCRGGVDK